MLLLCQCYRERANILKKNQCGINLYCNILLTNILVLTKFLCVPVPVDFLVCSRRTNLSRKGTSILSMPGKFSFDTMSFSSRTIPFISAYFVYGLSTMPKEKIYIFLHESYSSMGMGTPQTTHKVAISRHIHVLLCIHGCQHVQMWLFCILFFQRIAFGQCLECHCLISMLFTAALRLRFYGRILIFIW